MFLERLNVFTSKTNFHKNLLRWELPGLFLPPPPGCQPTDSPPPGYRCFLITRCRRWATTSSTASASRTTSSRRVTRMSGQPPLLAVLKGRMWPPIPWKSGKVPPGRRCRTQNSSKLEGKITRFLPCSSLIGIGLHRTFSRVHRTFSSEMSTPEPSVLQSRNEEAEQCQLPHADWRLDQAGTVVLA